MDTHFMLKFNEILLYFTGLLRMENPFLVTIAVPIPKW